jgi:VanZ family protein
MIAASDQSPTPLKRFRSITLRRVWRAIGVGLVMSVIWLSLTPRPIEVPIAQGDKLGHVAAYATLMLWFAQLDARYRARASYALAFVALGVALEFAQRLTGYRSFDINDMVAGAVGVLLGWVVAPPRGPDVLALLDRVL